MYPASYSAGFALNPAQRLAAPTVIYCNQDQFRVQAIIRAVCLRQYTITLLQ